MSDVEVRQKILGRMLEQFKDDVPDSDIGIIEDYEIHALCVLLTVRGAEGKKSLMTKNIVCANCGDFFVRGKNEPFYFIFDKNGEYRCRIHRECFPKDPRWPEGRRA